MKRVVTRGKRLLHAKLKGTPLNGIPTALQSVREADAGAPGAMEELGNNLMRGENLPFDERIQRFREREQKLLTIFDPDKDDLSYYNFIILAYTYSDVVVRQSFFWILLVGFYVVPLLYCTLWGGASQSYDDVLHSEALFSTNISAVDISNGVCYGPSRWKYADHFPSMMTGFSTFLLVFFTSHNYQRQRALFEKMIDLRTSLSAVVVLGVATAGNTSRPESTVRALELWRCANIINLLSFHAIDPVLFSLENFVLPVAEAFGDKSRGGMLPEGEVKRLKKLTRRAVENSGAFMNAAAKARYIERSAESMAELDLRDSLGSDSERGGWRTRMRGRVTSLFATTRMSAAVPAPSARDPAMEEGQQASEHASGRGPSLTVDTGVSLSQSSFEKTQAVRGSLAVRPPKLGRKQNAFENPKLKAKMVSVRNTVRRTHTAGALRQLYSARLLRVVDELLSKKLCKVAWPAWQASLRPLHDASETLEHSARHRMPRIYVLIVHTAVYLTIGVDFFFISTYVGQSFAQAPEFQYPWFTLALASGLCLFFLVVVTVVLDLSREFFNPFGEDHLNFPVLTWVAACCAESLTLIAENDDSLDDEGMTESAILPQNVLCTVPGAGVEPPEKLGGVAPAPSDRKVEFTGEAKLSKKSLEGVLPGIVERACGGPSSKAPAGLGIRMADMSRSSSTAVCISPAAASEAAATMG